MKVSVVIPNWNGAEKLRRNLPSVLKVKGVDEIIVADDGSTDDSVKVLETEFPQVKLVKRFSQGGFSTNVNFGVSYANGDLVFLINSDACPASDCLEYALSHFDNPQVFSVGLNVGGSWSWVRWEKGFFWHYENKEDTLLSHPTLWASGGSGIFRKSIWDKLNGLDENFNPFYEEDVDLGYRATKRGYLNIFEPKARVEHYKEPGVISQNYSAITIAKTAQRNQLFLIWKNIHDPRLISEHRQALIKLLLTHPKYWVIFLSALIKLPKILKLRKLEQKMSELTDAEVLNKYE